MSNRMKKSDYNKLFSELKDFADELDFKLKQKPKISEIQALVGIIKNTLEGALEKTHTEQKLSKEERAKEREKEFKSSPIYTDFVHFAEKWEALNFCVKKEFLTRQAGGKVQVFDCLPNTTPEGSPLFSRTFLVTPRKKRECKGHAKGSKKVKKVRSKE